MPLTVAAQSLGLPSCSALPLQEGKKRYCEILQQRRKRMMRKKHDREVGTPHPIPPSLAAILSSFMEGSSTCWFISFARHQPVAKEQLEAHSKENSPRACSNHGRQLVLVIQEHMSAEIQPWSRAESPSTVAAHKAAAGRCNSNETKLASGLR